MFMIRTLDKHQGYTERVELACEPLKLEIEVIDKREQVTERLIE